MSKIDAIRRIGQKDQSTSKIGAIKRIAQKESPERYSEGTTPRKSSPAAELNSLGLSNLERLSTAKKNYETLMRGPGKKVVTNSAPVQEQNTYNPFENEDFSPEMLDKLLNEAENKVAKLEQEEYSMLPGDINFALNLEEKTNERKKALDELNTLKAYKSEYEKYKAELAELEAFHNITKEIMAREGFAENSAYSPLPSKTSEQLQAEGYKRDDDGKWYKEYDNVVDYYTGEDDPTYTYINEGINDKIVSPYAYTSYEEEQGYNLLEDEEKAAYNFLHHQDRLNGTNTAKEYLDKITPMLNKRAMSKDAEYFAEYAKKYPALGSVYSVGTNYLNALAFPAKILSTATGTYDDNILLDSWGNETNAIRNAVSEDMGIVGRIAYNGVMALADMGTAFAAGGGNAKLVQAIMSSSAGSSTISNAKANGASDIKALVLGLGSAAIEAATEKWSIEALLKKPERILEYIGTNILTEGTEEGASNIGNVALDLIVSKVFGDRNEIEKRIDYLITYEGKTPSEALQITFNEKAQELTEDVIVGAFSGASMSTIASSPYIASKTLDKIKSNREDNKIAKSAMGNDKVLFDIIAKGKESEEGAESYTLAQEIEKAKEDGTLTQEQVKKLVASNEAYAKEKEEAAYTSLEKLAAEIVTSRNSRLSLEEQLDKLTEANEEITAEEAREASGFGERGSQLLAELANQSGMTYTKAKNIIESAYLDGFSNENATNDNYSSLWEKNAVTVAKIDRLTQEAEANARAKTATVYDGVFTENDYTKNFTKAERKMISTVAKSLKMDISVVDKIIANTIDGIDYEANAQHVDGKMKISSTAEKVIYGLVIHEAGHRMKQLAPSDFGVLMNTLYERAERRSSKAVLGVNGVSAFGDVKLEHDEAGLPMETLDYIEEIAVRELETIFSSAREFNKWYAQISGNKQLLTKWERFVNWLYEIIDDIKRTWTQAKMSPEERAQAQKSIEELDRIKSLLANTYKSAEAAAKQRSQEVKGKNLQNDGGIKSAESYNETVSNSIKKPWHTGLNKTEIQKVLGWIEQAGAPETKRITDTACWYKGYLEGEPIFAIYSTEDMTPKPTILYFSRGDKAKTEFDILSDLLEDENNGKNIIEKSTASQEVFEGNWLRYVHDSQNNKAYVGTRIDNRNVGVLRGEPQRNGTRAYWDVIENLFETQYRGRLNKTSIRFSLKKPVEETKDLIAVHNTRADKLLEALRLGGLPSPSIAITKTDVSHEKFGDISLVFRKDSINPTNRRNKIYSGDAYTPTGVRVEYDVDDDVVQAFNKRLKELTPEWEIERLPSVNAGTATAENDSLYSAYERNGRAKLAFLREKGNALKVAMRTPRLSYFVSNDTVVALAKAFSAKQLNDIANTSEGLNQYKNAFLKVIRDTEDSRHVESGIYSAEEASAFDIAETARKAANLKENKYKIEKEVDNRKTYELIDKKFSKALKAEYRAWIDENTKDAIVDKGIRNNRDLFTPSGNRRSFKQLHEPYNLDNIVKKMISGEDKGVALFGGSPTGAAQREYSSIADVKADSGRIQQLEQKEYDKIRDEIEGDVLELAQKMQIRSDAFAVRDLLSEAIGKKTKQQADAHLKRESQGWANYSPEFTDELWEIRDRILKMPTEYFEAKPQRAVNFNEVVLAVLPIGMTELRKQLEDAGVQKVVYYHKDIEGDRLKKVNSVPNVNFSLKKRDSGMTAKETQKLLDTIENLKKEFKVTKFAKADPKKLAKMTKELLKEYDSAWEYDEAYAAIDALYQYMANGEDGHPAVWEDVYDRAYNIAQGMIENAVIVDDSLYQEYEGLRKYIRSTPIKFNTLTDEVPSGYENFNDFRRKNFGKFNFTRDGLGIDEFYQELADLYPEYFNTDEQTDAAAQLERIVHVLDEIQPFEINSYAQDIKGATAFLATDIANRFFDVPQAKATFADKAERKVIETRIAARKKLDKVREQRNNAIKKEKAKHKESLAKMSEKQKAKVLRARITQHVTDLSNKLISGTDNKHIPQDLQGAVSTLLYCINLESNYTYDVNSHSYKKNDEGLPTSRTKAFEELRKVYAEIASTAVVDPDLMGEDGLLSDVITLADKRIADMKSSELETVWRAIQAIEASISTANKVFSEGKYAAISDFAEKLRTDNEGKKDKRELRKGGGLQRAATLNMLTPETFLHYLGDAGDSMFRIMRDAQDKHVTIMKEVADFTRKATKDVNVNKLKNEMHTVTLGGESVKLSTAQLMELYVLMKREQAADHIFVGGILPDVTDGKGKWKESRAEPIRNITPSEIDAALSVLTSEQKKVADELQKFVSTVLSDYGNEASMQVYNYEKFTEKNYWTIRTNKQEIKSDIGKDTAVTTVANKGMTKRTKPHANTSLRIGSIFDTFASHSSEMATYAAWLGATEDINRIRNFVFWENGVRKGTVKGIIDTVHGRDEGSAYLAKLLTDISIGVKGTDNMNPFDKLIGSYKAASVGANLRVIIQQPTAILRALDMIDAQYIVSGSLGPLKGWKKAKKYAPIAQWKDWGHFDINTGRQMMDILFDNANAVEKIKQVGMWGASMADSLAWGTLWNAVEAEIKAKNNGLEVGSQEYYEAVAKRFTEIIDHTQVVDGILQRSQFMRSADNFTKMATSFMGEPTKQYNMFMYSMYDARTGRSGAVARLGRAAASLAVANIINACFQSIIDAMRDDDKEKDYWEKWLSAFGGNILDTVNPLGYIPFVKDVVSVFKGYDVKRMDTESITKTANAATNMYKAVTGTGKYTIAEASVALFAEVARLFGVPVANIKRDIKSLVTMVAIETDNYLMQYRMEKAMLNINYAGNSKNFMDILYNAYVNDREAYEIIYKDLLDSGFEADKIQSGMETRMKKAEGVEKSSDLLKRYMAPADEKKYDSSLNRVKTSSAWKKANAEQRKDAEADLYKFLTSTSDSMTKTRFEAKTYGVDETEYVLWQLAKDVVNDKISSLNAKEKAAAIDMLNMGNSELAYFYGTETSDKAYANGVSIENFAKFKAAVSGLKGDDKQAKVEAYAQKYGQNTKEILFFMGTVYDSYKKRADYIKYFGYEK